MRAKIFVSLTDRTGWEKQHMASSFSQAQARRRRNFIALAAARCKEIDGSGMVANVKPI